MRYPNTALWATILAAIVLSAPEAQAQDKYALGVFHFNVQYVAGGMYGYWAVPNAELDLDAGQIEDLIITESLAPVIELYKQHPAWGVDIEMQGYMLDVLAARHPQLLDTMRTMAKASQIDIVSFHYSDQLYIAYPQVDWERSQKLTAETFKKHDIPLSRSVFCQEGQAGAALAAAMKQAGYQTLVWPKNLWIYQHGDFEAQPLYAFGDGFVIAGSKGVSYQQGNTDISVTWTFLDDGELLATDDFNPYFPDLFKHDPAAVAEYEAGLLALESQGYKISTVDQYVEAVKSKVIPAQLPPLLDGTWQPNSTDGVLKWLGGSGLWYADERDNEVRTLGALAHRELLAAETIAAQAGLDAQAKLAGAWKLMFLGQVSDASGINPFRGEVEYGIAHESEALRIAREVIRQAKEKLSFAQVTIDPAANTAVEGPQSGESATPLQEAPLALVIDGGDRKVTQRWERMSPNKVSVEIQFGSGESPYLQVLFPGTGAESFTTTRALDDHTPVTYQRKDFVFEHFYLALPTGLISLDSGLFVIKDQAFVHLAAKVEAQSGDILFADNTALPNTPVTWRFELVEGTAEQAVQEALALNGTRRLVR